MMRAPRSIALAVAVAAPLGVHGDIPVHCLNHQIVGTWQFTLGALSEKRSSCGHAHPDVETLQPGRDVVDKNPAGEVVTMALSSPNMAASATLGKGQWTMVYDEGFEVNVQDFSFFAFSNFTFEGPKHSNISHCGQTMVGWYSTVNRSKYGCYYGVRDGGHVEVPPLAQPQAKVSTLKAVAAKGIYDGQIDHSAQKKHVAKLNKKLGMLQLGWRARVMPKWNGRTMQEVNSYAGIKRATPARTYHREMLRQHASSKAESRSFLQRSLFETTVSDFDWANASGVDFLEPVMDQADCGSCYAASSVRMLTSRHKIKMNDTQLLPWSISFPLHCSEYNQGCKGGYGFLLSKWSSDVGLLPANCMRYSTTGSCKLECNLAELEGKRYRVGNHRYVGSYFGKSNANLIQEELYRSGPLAVGIEPDDDFMFYSDGVFRSMKSIGAATHPADKTAEGMAPLEWEQVDHAVLLVGWGAEAGQPYWRIQNSWGPDWGEDGFFRIARGIDEAAIESQAEAADVVEDETTGKRVEELFTQMSDPLRASARQVAAVRPHTQKTTLF